MAIDPTRSIHVLTPSSSEQNKEAVRELYRHLIELFPNPREGLIALMILAVSLIKGNSTLSKEQYMEVCKDMYEDVDVIKSEVV